MLSCCAPEDARLYFDELLHYYSRPDQEEGPAFALLDTMLYLPLDVYKRQVKGSPAAEAGYTAAV